MEPAVYRREHMGLIELIEKGSRSQWSPPFIGGGNSGAKRENGLIYLSQWSPPFIGGSTPPCRRRRGRPARSQWSPPFIGGSTTRRGEVSASHAPDVAMEPAVYRREHRTPGRRRAGRHSS